MNNIDYFVSDIFSYVLMKKRDIPLTLGIGCDEKKGGKSNV